MVNAFIGEREVTLCAASSTATCRDNGLLYHLRRRRREDGDAVDGVALPLALVTPLVAVASWIAAKGIHYLPRLRVPDVQMTQRGARDQRVPEREDRKIDGICAGFAVEPDHPGGHVPDLDTAIRISAGDPVTMRQDHYAYHAGAE